ncbi:Hsp70 family protein [Methylocystis hirsuta]|uniref:Hsp70 family protein n=1 Tax=Methylocystis hirsuta TaxID=369798 RepID=UPI001AED0405|nr:Hsp70 family protein [Methylocystis hirsuta]
MPIIGIDLDSSNSAAAALRGGRPTVIPSSEGFTLGGKAFPSFVALTAGGQMLVGEPARRQATANPEGTTTAFKRLMGRREKVRLRDREFSPEELSGFLLQKIKRDAEAFLGESIKQAVVTVPAYFAWLFPLGTPLRQRSQGRHWLSGARVLLPCPIDLPEFASVRRYVEVAELDDPRLVASHRGRQREDSTREIDAIDYSKPAAASRFVGDPTQKAVFEAHGQHFAA